MTMGHNWTNVTDEFVHFHFFLVNIPCRPSGGHDGCVFEPNDLGRQGATLFDGGEDPANWASCAPAIS